MSPFATMRCSLCATVGVVSIRPGSTTLSADIGGTSTTLRRGIADIGWCLACLSRAGSSAGKPSRRARHKDNANAI